MERLGKKYIYLFYEKKVGKRWKPEKMRMRRSEAEAWARKILANKKFMREMVAIIMSRIRPLWLFGKRRD